VGAIAELERNLITSGSVPVCGGPSSKAGASDAGRSISIVQLSSAIAIAD
jgi:hypothetical protein